MEQDNSLERALLGGSELVFATTESDAEKRIDPTVSTNDRKWAKTYNEFRELLDSSEETIGQILSEHFTQHEARMFMPSDRPSLKALQEENTDRYHRLLEGRFHDVEFNLATKLTMMYFGLPVEPLVFDLGGLTEALEIREPEAPRFDVQPPLHFLTAHKQRNWGKESLRGREDASYPLPVAPSNEESVAYLRGGASGSGSQNGSDQSDDEDLEMDIENLLIDYVPRDEPPPKPDSGNWVDLYGFQGVVPFVPGNWQTFGMAIRQLLSLRPDEEKTKEFTIVHFDKKSSRSIHEIWDTLPLESDCATMAYINNCIEENGLSYHQKKSTFFVKLKSEKTPPSWKPLDQQLETDVTQVRWVHPDANRRTKNPPTSHAYIAFPKTNPPESLPEQVSRWGANQYGPYIQTALEVLVGRPQRSFHHAQYRLCGADTDLNKLSLLYGLTDICPLDLRSLVPLLSDGKIMELRQEQPLEHDEIAFVLPGCHPPSDEVEGTVVKKHTPTMFPNATQVIWRMLRILLGDNIYQLKSVRLLSGSGTLGSDIDRDQPHTSILLSEDQTGLKHAPLYDALEQFVKYENPFVLLYPEWPDHQTFIYATESKKGKQENEPRVPMPPLSSTVHQFRTNVSKLMDFTGHPQDRIERIARGEGHISIQPMMEPEPEKEQEPNKPKPVGPVEHLLDFPCFFIGPNTTNDEWFSIRARIPTRRAIVNILKDGKWDWQSQVSASSLWGPRYGRVGEAKKRIQKQIHQPNKTTRFANSIQRLNPQEPANESRPRQDAPIGSNAQIRHHQPQQNLALRHDTERSQTGKDDRQTSWARQPSIFDYHNAHARPANSNLRIPMNAPPAEHMLRIGGRVPMISKAILTLTEQAELQQALWDVRNTILERVVKCSYEGCNFTYRSIDQAEISNHLKLKHGRKECLWCDEPRFAIWNEKQRNEHYREKHKDKLWEILGVTGATIKGHTSNGTISIPLRKVSRRNGEYEGLAMLPGPEDNTQLLALPQPQRKLHGFCDCCGRSRDFYSKSEKKYHDRQCIEGIYNGAKCKYCAVCGNHFWLTKQDAKRSNMPNGQQASCSHDVNNKVGPYCHLCGFDMSGVSSEGRNQHRAACKGFSAEAGNFCCYCGIAFLRNETQDDKNDNLDHMEKCFEKIKAQGGLRPPHEIAFEQQQHSLRNQFALGTLQGQGPVNIPQNSVNPEKSKTPEMSGHLTTPPESTPDKEAPKENEGVSKPPVSKRAKIGNRESRAKTGASKTAEKPPNDAGDKVEPPKPAESTKKPKAPAKSKTAAATKAKPARKPRARSESPEGPESSEPDESSSNGEGDDDDEYEDENEDENEELSEYESGDENRGRRKRRRQKRRKDRDGAYRDNGQDEDDDEPSQDEQAPDKPRRRPKSPNWIRMLGPDDPTFDPCGGDYYCSRCFRKAPKKAHKRDRSPLGIKKENELHGNKDRCCKIRNGVGLAKNLPNRSGWIPFKEMPKPLTNLRKNFLKKYPAYSRTIYPLNDANRTGTYWRADPNNDDNSSWWDMPWPPYEGEPPFPGGWNAPDAPDDPQTTARNGQAFKLRVVPDLNYRYASDKDDEEGDEDIDDDASKSKKRKRTKASKQQANPLPLAARITRPGETTSVTINAAGQKTGKRGTQQSTVPTRRSTRKRQKTVHE